MTTSASTKTDGARDYADEAFRIALGSSPLLPERAHLQVLLDKVLLLRRLVTAVLVHDEVTERLFPQALLAASDEVLDITRHPDGTVTVERVGTAVPVPTVPQPRSVM